MSLDGDWGTCSQQKRRVGGFECNSIAALVFPLTSIGLLIVEGWKLSYGEIFEVICPCKQKPADGRLWYGKEDKDVCWYLVYRLNMGL